MRTIVSEHHCKYSKVTSTSTRTRTYSFRLGTRKGKAEWEAADYYSSDEDDFTDRTGDLERRRRARKRRIWRVCTKDRHAHCRLPRTLCLCCSSKQQAAIYLCTVQYTVLYSAVFKCKLTSSYCIYNTVSRVSHTLGIWAQSILLYLLYFNDCSARRWPRSMSKLHLLNKSSVQYSYSYQQILNTKVIIFIRFFLYVFVLQYFFND